MTDSKTPRGGLLDLIERIGNRLPDPATLFLLGTLFVMVLSAVAVWGDWHVLERLPEPVLEEFTSEDGQVGTRPVMDENLEPVIDWVETGEIMRPQSLLTRDGLFWAVESLVDNFMAFPPLGIVLVGMLGIGIAERTGLIGALLKAFMLVVPNRLLTPAMVFIGIMSSMTLDAGYVVLPPLAAALYIAVGRSPLAGLAAVFAGVAAGFNANLFITGLDPMLAGFATEGGQVIDPDYVMNPACNWYFMIASTFVMTLTGWGVTSFFVERRLKHKSPDEGGPAIPSSDDLANQRLRPEEIKSMRVAVGVFAVVMAIIFASIFIKGAPLYTYTMVDPANPDSTLVAEIWTAPTADATPPANAVVDGDTVLVPSARRFARWVDSIVPLLFLSFIIPAIAYGLSIGSVKNDKDIAKLLLESMASMAPIIVLAFFAAQFIEFFDYSGLDTMLAMAGGQALGQAGLPPWMLVISFILVTMLFNLFIGSMSAKYAMFAPIFIPMFMMVGISPELTQAAYRIGDSVSNIITPLNAYLIIILVFMQKFVPRGGMGTLISTMLPYTIVFTIVWCIMLMVWMAMGWDLGPDGPLTYNLNQ